ncbi:MAG: SecDF P1 head subdomain-containing protein, partial [Gammaproteobacteria bacterium]
MNTNAWWRVALVVLVTTLSALYALPNFYPDEPAIQVSGASAATALGEDVAEHARAALVEAGLPYRGHERVGGSFLFRIGDAEAQIKAKEVVQQALGNGFVVALNLAPTTPQWLLDIGADPMKLGLDLRGGAHFKLEVDMDKAIALREEAWIDQIRSLLREKMTDGQRYRSVRRAAAGGIEVRFDSAAARDNGLRALTAGLPDFAMEPEDADGEFRLRLRLTEQAVKEIRDYAIDQNRTTIANRVNELGVAEPLVQRLGANRIVVELPGVQDTATAKRVLGRTASLEFRLVDAENPGPWYPGSPVPPGSEAFPFKENREPARLLKREKIVTGESVINARAGFDQDTSTPNVSITLDSKGGRAMQRTTSEHVGKPMAVLFVETRATAR